MNGGLRIHTRYHVTGRATPSHEWTEGLLDYYLFTGRQEVIALRHGYAGRSLLSMSLTAHAPWRHGGTHVHSPDLP